MRRSLVLLALALLVGGCSRDAEEAAPTTEATPPVETAPPPVRVRRIHDLGVNPADGIIVVATDRGIYQLVVPGPRLDRLSADPFDATALAVVGPGRYFSSGHRPEGREDVPEDLGLLQTADGGRFWEAVSLVNEAAFVAIRIAGTSVYAYDRERRRLFVSRDGGVEWAPRPTPVRFADFTFDPVDSEHLVATADDGLYQSPDGGATWRRTGSARGLLAWPDGDRLYVAAPDGTLRRSADAGASFMRVGRIGGEPTALAAAGPQQLVAAVEGPAIMRSGDGGATWSEFWQSGTIG